MSEQDVSNVTNTPSTESDSSQHDSATQDNHVLAKLLLEIQQTPEEYLPNLLQIVRLFRESVTMKSVRSHTYAKAMDEIKNPDPVKKSVQQIALSELLRQWEEEGDEQEQTETAQILQQDLRRIGVTLNIVPNRCELTFEIRNLDTNAIVAKLEEMLG